MSPLIAVYVLVYEMDSLNEDRTPRWDLDGKVKLIDSDGTIISLDEKVKDFFGAADRRNDGQRQQD